MPTGLDQVYKCVEEGEGGTVDEPAAADPARRRVQGLQRLGFLHGREQAHQAHVPEGHQQPLFLHLGQDDQGTMVARSATFFGELFLLHHC